MEKISCSYFPEFVYVVDSPGEAASNANDSNLLLGRHGRGARKRNVVVVTFETLLVVFSKLAKQNKL